MSTADELMGLAAGLRRVVRRRLRAELPGPALRGAQLELLQLVEAEPGVGVAAAARSLHLAGNTVSTLVNQLVAAGMVHRAVDPADRRAARLYAHRRRRGAVSRGGGRRAACSSPTRWPGSPTASSPPGGRLARVEEPRHGS